MSTQVIVLPPQLEVGPQFPGGSGAHRTVMVTGSLYKRSGFPAFHTRSRHRNPVDSAALYLHVAADLVETLTPKELASSGNMLNRSEPVIVGGGAFDEGCSCHSQLQVPSKLREEIFEVVRTESNIRVQIPDYVETLTLHSFRPGIEALDLCSEVECILSPNSW